MYRKKGKKTGEGWMGQMGLLSKAEQTIARGNSLSETGCKQEYVDHGYCPGSSVKITVFHYIVIATV